MLNESREIAFRQRQRVKKKEKKKKIIQTGTLIRGLIKIRDTSFGINHGSRNAFSGSRLLWIFETIENGRSSEVFVGFYARTTTTVTYNPPYNTPSDGAERRNLELKWNSTLVVVELLSVCNLSKKVHLTPLLWNYGYSFSLLLSSALSSSLLLSCLRFPRRGVTTGAQELLKPLSKTTLKIFEKFPSSEHTHRQIKTDYIYVLERNSQTPNLNVESFLLLFVLKYYATYRSRLLILRLTCLLTLQGHVVSLVL